MANPSFIDALSNLRRKAQLSGRPLTKQETAGAVAGYADTASERLSRGRALQLEKQRLDQAKIEADRNYRLRAEAMSDAQRQQTLSNVVGAGTLGYLAGPTVGAALGGGAGAAAGAGSAIAGMGLTAPTAAAAGGVGGGAAAGALAGPIGALIGAGVGFVISKCMIISACEGPESYEVELSRRYRDRYMSLYELAGYYTIAPSVAGLIHKSPLFKRLVKTQLVDRLIDYAEWLFEIKAEMKHPFISKWVTRGFLGSCKAMGMVKLKKEIKYAQSVF